MKRWIALASAMMALGCGEPIDRPSEVRSLRVLAVSAEPVFAKPGTTVPLNMLLYDGHPGAPRSISTIWIASCINPPGDLYYACYPVLRETLARWPKEELAAGRVAEALGALGGSGTRFDVAVPEDAISGRAQPPGVVHPYGIVYAFFASCAGELRAEETGSEQALPIRCVDSSSGKDLGADDFEFGYYAVYVYNDLLNHNPGLSEVRFNGAAGGRACAGQQDCEAGQHCSSASECIPTVPRCPGDSGDCPLYRFAPLVERSTLEPAVTANLREGEARPEAFWVSYYSTGGHWDKDVRMVHDPYAGWAEDYDGKWRAPPEGGVEVKLWAVMRDSRNGVTWRERGVYVE